MLATILTLGCVGFALISNGDTIVEKYVETYETIEEIKDDMIYDMYEDYGKEIYEGKLEISPVKVEMEKNNKCMVVEIDYTIENDVYKFELSFSWDSDMETWDGNELWIYSERDNVWMNENDEYWGDVLENRYPWLD